MRRKRPLENGTQPPRKQLRKTKPKIERRIFETQPQFCQDLVSSLITLAEMVEKSQVEAIDVHHLLHGSASVLQQVGLLKRELQIQLPQNDPSRHCAKQKVVEILQEIVTEAQNWQEKICVVGLSLYDHGSTLSESALHCLLVWQKVFNQLQHDILQSHDASWKSFQNSLEFFAKDEDVEELLSRLKTATNRNPLIVSWKQHLPEFPREFTEQAAISLAEKLHFLGKFAYEKAYYEAKESVKNEIAFNKHFEKLYSQYEKLSYRACHHFATTKFPWWCRNEEEGLLWIRTAPIKFASSSFYIFHLGRLKEEFLSHVKKFSWTQAPKKHERTSLPPTKNGTLPAETQASFMPLIHGGQTFYVPIVQPLLEGRQKAQNEFPFLLPSTLPNGVHSTNS